MLEMYIFVCALPMYAHAMQRMIGLPIPKSDESENELPNMMHLVQISILATSCTEVFHVL
jgi:hypothetical protein